MIFADALAGVARFAAQRNGGVAIMALLLRGTTCDMALLRAAGEIALRGARVVLVLLLLRVAERGMVFARAALVRVNYKGAHYMCNSLGKC